MIDEIVSRYICESKGDDNVTIKLMKVVADEFGGDFKYYMDKYPMVVIKVKSGREMVLMELLEDSGEISIIKWYTKAASGKDVLDFKDWDTKYFIPLHNKMKSLGYREKRRRDNLVQRKLYSENIYYHIK